MTQPTSQPNADNKERYSIASIIMILAATILFTLTMMALSSFGEAGGNANIAPVRNRMSLPVIIHMATVIPAVPLGAYILWRKKGDAAHKMLGRIWGILMLVTAISSFWIGRPAGQGLMGTHLSPIHIFSIVTLISIPFAVFLARFGKIKDHYQAMQGTYIGLITAGLFSFIPGRIMGNLVFG